jgi:hypothetical protein
MTTKDELKHLLKTLATESEAGLVEAEAADFLQKVDPLMLSIAEQELMEEGVGQEELRSLCDVHLKVLGGKLERQRAQTELGHPIDLLMAEHQIILQNLTSLQTIIEKASNRDNGEIGDLMAQLKAVVHLLLETESHHKREEDALFPRLERRGVTGPPRIMRLEHDALRARKHRLGALVEKGESTAYAEFIRELNDAGGYIVANLRDHIFKEDNILYPTAMQTLDPAEWEDVQAEFDQIGYCSFTPGKN